MPAAKKPALSAKDKREFALLNKLQANHGYMLTELKLTAEQSTSTFKRGGTKLEYTPAVCYRLAVPETSALGKAILRTRKTKATKKGTKR